jgi:glucose-6-phosphate 1-dehydrogenase
MPRDIQMVSRVIPVEPFDLVIFGGTGDLARRKILPGLYRRFTAGQMPPEARVIGAARSEMSEEAYRETVGEAIAEFVPERHRTPETVAAFLARMTMCGWTRPDRGLGGARADHGPRRVRAFYFSVAPALFGDIAERLHEHRIAGPHCRIVVEKPFGHDLASARELNRTLARYFDETQIYRIDHYLGKETVQNLMAVRFANILFEPCGTRATSTTSRSRWPRPWAWAGAAATTTPRARCATWCRTT